jgi:putative ABC transport system permease protein
LLVESTVLAILGGAAGLAVSAAGVRVLFSAIPEGITPYWVDHSLDLRAFAALVTASFGAALLFGLVPALHGSKTDVTRVLKSGDRTGTGPRGHRRLTTAFLAVQLALAVTLLAQVGLASLATTADVPTDRAIDTSEVLTATLMLPADRYATPDRRAAFVRRVEERLGVHPSLEAHTFASSLPVSGASASGLDIAGRPRSEPEDAPAVWSVAIGPRYFETLRLPLVRGREFSTEDGRPGQTHAIVNERLAELFFAGVDPLGQRIALIPPGTATKASELLTIVGVAPTVRQRPTPTPDPVVYLPIHAAPQPPSC